MAALLPALRVLNVVTGILGFIPFAMENFGPPDSAASVIKFTVGLDVAGGLQNAGGDLPDVRLFNEGGEFLGIATDPGYVGDGSTAEIKVKHNNNNGQQAAYALFSANGDAVCVASISITWPNGDQYGWVGDWGQACGGSWYYSNVFIKGSDYKPNCLWIDANGDQPQTGFQVHFPEFVSKDDQDPAPIKQDVSYYCNSGPPFKLYTERDPRGITFWTLRNGRKSKRHSPLAPPSRTVSHIHQRRQTQDQNITTPYNTTDDNTTNNTIPYNATDPTNTDNNSTPFNATDPNNNNNNNNNNNTIPYNATDPNNTVNNSTPFNATDPNNPTIDNNNTTTTNPTPSNATDPNSPTSTIPTYPTYPTYPTTTIPTYPTYPTTTAARFGDYLVLSDAPSHSALALCNSTTSVGPDFASAAERLFCRMSDKTLWPFCGDKAAEGSTEGCFDVERQQLVVGGKVARRGRYVKVFSWGGGGGGGKGEGGGGGQ